MAVEYDLTAAEAALKELYSDQRVGRLVYENNPFLARVPKNTRFFGKSMPQPIVTSPGAGASASFAATLANQQAPEPVAFNVHRRRGYAIATIDRETMLASESNIGAFLESSSFVIDMKVRELTNVLAAGLYRSGTGTIGVISGAVQTGVITLSHSADATFFERGMVLEASATDGGSARAAKGYVIAVDRDLGKVTVATSAGGSAATPSGWVDADCLRVEGNRNQAVDGLLSWLPKTAPTSGDSHWGVDRSDDPTKLAGIRFDGGDLPIETALVRAAVRLGREGGMPNECYMSFDSFGALIDSLGSKVKYVEEKGPAGIGFTGVQIHGGPGAIKVFPDRNCPPNTAFLLQMNSWKFRSLKNAPHLATTGQGLLLPDGDAYQVRVAFYGNLFCDAPGHNAVVTLGA